MSWMTKWAGPFPLFVDSRGRRALHRRRRARLRRPLPRRHRRDDRPLAAGDGRRDPRAARPRHHLDAADRGRRRRRARRCRARFGLPLWQFTLSATDANRHAIRYARHLTGRSKIVVHDWCYHGSVDETFAVLDDDGRTVARPGNIGPPVALDETTRVVEYNDIDGLEHALAVGDVAAVLMEPALTNIGIVLPEARLPRGVPRTHPRYGALWIVDETHTLSVGPGRLDRDARAAPRPADRRQAARRRHPVRRVRHDRADRRRDRARTSSSRRSTSAASAARSPATRSRSPRCARR